MPRCRSRAPTGSKANDSLRPRKTLHLIDGRCHRHRFIGHPAREAMMRPFRLFETSSQISYRHPTATNYPRCPRSDFDAVPRVVHSIPNSPRGLIVGWPPAIHTVTDVYVESSVVRIPATGALSSLNSVPNRHSIHYNSLITPGESYPRGSHITAHDYYAGADLRACPARVSSCYFREYIRLMDWERVLVYIQSSMPQFPALHYSSGGYEHGNKRDGRDAG